VANMANENGLRARGIKQAGGKGLLVGNLLFTE
jgi:hypothetical protein